MQPSVPQMSGSSSPEFSASTASTASLYRRWRFGQLSLPDRGSRLAEAWRGLSPVARVSRMDSDGFGGNFKFVIAMERGD